MHQIILDSLKGHIPDALLNKTTKKKPLGKTMADLLAEKKIDDKPNTTSNSEGEKNVLRSLRL